LNPLHTDTIGASAEPAHWPGTRWLRPLGTNAFLRGTADGSAISRTWRPVEHLSPSVASAYSACPSSNPTLHHAASRTPLCCMD